MRLISKQKGFTVVELMISTAIFSTVLLVIAVTITQVGRMYYKGVTNAKTQETARSLVDRIAQEIQYSPESLTPTFATSGTRNVRCVGNSRFFYVLNQQKTTSNYAIWTDDNASGSALCVNSGSLAALSTATIPTVGATNSRELLPLNTRVVKFDISGGTNGLYTVSIRVLYGDSDLMVDPTGGDPSDTVCRGSSIGTQFCGMSEITSVVRKRL